MVKKLKLSEARILIYLNQAEPRYKYARRMSSKLNIDYGYLIGILNGLHSKKWLHKIKRGNKRFYELNKIAPINEAYDRRVVK